MYALQGKDGVNKDIFMILLFPKLLYSSNIVNVVPYSFIIATAATGR